MMPPFTSLNLYFWKFKKILVMNVSWFVEKYFLMNLEMTWCLLLPCWIYFYWKISKFLVMNVSWFVEKIFVWLRGVGLWTSAEPILAPNKSHHHFGKPSLATNTGRGDKPNFTTKKSRNQNQGHKTSDLQKYLEKILEIPSGENFFSISSRLDILNPRVTLATLTAFFVRTMWITWSRGVVNQWRWRKKTQKSLNIYRNTLDKIHFDYWLIVGLGWWFEILGVPLSNNPFHKGSQESKPPTQTTN